MPSITLAEIPYARFEDRSTDPTDTPASGYAFIYVKSNGWFIKLDSGSVVQIGGAFALDDLTDVSLSGSETTGSVLVHNGTNFVDLAIGTDGQVLVADSGQTEGVQWQTFSSAVDEDAQLLAWLGLQSGAI